jgi:hypothetical protein
MGPLLGKNVPKVWAISEKAWQQNGVAEALWWGTDGEQIRLKDMALLPLPLEVNLPILGKQLRERSPMQKR